jgi:hypothetical protein
MCDNLILSEDKGVSGGGTLDKDAANINESEETECKLKDPCCIDGCCKTKH